jgi:hypothetical protein
VKYGGMGPSDVQRLNGLEEENRRLNVEFSSGHEVLASGLCFGMHPADEVHGEEMLTGQV